MIYLLENLDEHIKKHSYLEYYPQVLSPARLLLSPWSDLRRWNPVRHSPAVQFYSDEACFNNTFANIKIILPGYSWVYTRLQPTVGTDSLNERVIYQAAGWPRRMYQRGGGAAAVFGCNQRPYIREMIHSALNLIH